MTAPRLTIRSVELETRHVTLRLPFRFGDTVVTEAREAYLTLNADTQIGPVKGVSAELMVPRWFDKRPGQSNDDTVETLRRSILAAMDAVDEAAGTAADIAFAVRAEVIAALRDVPALAAGFGPALVEMALLDVAAKASGLSFVQAARADAFGLGLHAPADLGREALAAFLGDLAPVRRIRIRHTVGYDAPLEAEPSLAADAPPTALANVIARQGIGAFKIKLKGNPAEDIERLRAVTKTIEATMGVAVPYTATLDANEQYLAESFADFTARLVADPALERLRGALRFIEQPLPRELTLTERAPPAPVPLLIDEADDGMDAFPQAIARGWSGTSVKSCKGVLRALINGARARAAGAMLSAEDLTCQPGLCWQQDTVMAATLGLADIERNGHHFAGGMQGASRVERAARAQAHPQVYDGVSLRIIGGGVDIGSLIDAPGFASTPTSSPDRTDHKT